MKYFLGVDIGSTKSHALIADETGQAVGFGAGGAGNHESVGVDNFRIVLNQVVHQAIGQAGITVNSIAGAGFGIAGYDWDSDRPMMREVIETLALKCPYEFVNDSVLGLFAGAKAGWGVSVTAGTSGNAYGRTLDGREGRMTGNGAFFGEYGGGWELVGVAMQAISRAWSLRGAPTALSDIFVRELGAKDVSDLLEGIARSRYHVGAKHAPLVFGAAGEGDEVAQEAIRFISRGLGDLAVGIIRQLQIEGEAFEVVLGGSFYNGSPLIEPIMREEICKVAPHAQLVRLNAAPVIGGVVLGMQQARHPFQPLREHLFAAAGELMRTAKL
jgi:N-acetylglucosamine kinase-like BadF-type ATPase